MPNMNEFSPSIVGDLGALLSIVSRNQGARKKLQEAIAEALPLIAKTPEPQRLNRANNVLIGMSECGLFDLATSRLTPFGVELLLETNDENRHRDFARRLLVDLHGDDLVDVVQMIRDRGERVSLQAIREELRSRDFAVTENSGDASKIRMWLQLTGVIDADWLVDDDVLESLVGVSTTGLGKWRELTRAQRAFIEQLRRLDGDVEGWVSVRQVKSLCEAQFGRGIFPEGRLRHEVIAPLEAANWIDSQGVRSHGGGRGGDSGSVRATYSLMRVELPLHIDATSGIPVDLRARLSTPLVEIFRDLESESTFVKGIALELLTLRLTRDIGLFPQGFRLRSAKTRGAEVDLIADGLHLHYSRWLLQCKNTRVVHVHDIAKEVGMAVVLKAHVVVLVTTGRFSESVVVFAKGLAETSPIQAILIDRRVLARYRDGGSAVVIDHLRSSARSVLRLKASQAHVVDEED